MNQYMTLLGSEQVERAAYEIREAAVRMEHAANEMSEAARRIEQAILNMPQPEVKGEQP